MLSNINPTPLTFANKIDLENALCNGTVPSEVADIVWNLLATYERGNPQIDRQREYEELEWEKEDLENDLSSLEYELEDAKEEIRELRRELREVKPNLY